MNEALLAASVERYVQWLREHSDAASAEAAERGERRAFYQAWTAERLLKLDRDDLVSFLGRLWALAMWGDKERIADYTIELNGLEKLRTELAELLWGRHPLAERWDRFRANVRNIGPAQISELLCCVHPAECVVLNRRTQRGLRSLDSRVPTRSHQLTGARYVEVCDIGKRILTELRDAGLESADLLDVNYFVWQELQAVGAPQSPDTPAETEPDDVPEFMHNDIRDKIREVGEWLGFKGDIEKRVAEGSKVDAVWEATIGNMGRVIYVFEVQTGGSIDSLIINLLKALNNPAVQGVVAVSDAGQIEKIKRYADGVQGLAGKLKCWNYEDVLRTHERLETVYESINSLGLVPDGF